MAALRPDEALTGRVVSVETLDERHREGLRAAAEASPEIFRFSLAALRELAGLAA